MDLAVTSTSVTYPPNPEGKPQGPLETTESISLWDWPTDLSLSSCKRRGDTSDHRAKSVVYMAKNCCLVPGILQPSKNKKQINMQPLVCIGLTMTWDRSMVATEAMNPWVIWGLVLPGLKVKSQNINSCNVYVVNDSEYTPNISLSLWKVLHLVPETYTFLKKYPRHYLINSLTILICITLCSPQGIFLLLWKDKYKIGRCLAFPCCLLSSSHLP